MYACMYCVSLYVMWYDVMCMCVCVWEREREIMQKTKVLYATGLCVCSCQLSHRYGEIIPRVQGKHPTGTGNIPRVQGKHQGKHITGTGKTSGKTSHRYRENIRENIPRVQGKHQGKHPTGTGKSSHRYGENKIAATLRTDKWAELLSCYGRHRLEFPTRTFASGINRVCQNAISMFPQEMCDYCSFCHSVHAVCFLQHTNWTDVCSSLIQL